jgi:hypothetical protein
LSEHTAKQKVARRQLTPLHFDRHCDAPTFFSSWKTFPAASLVTRYPSPGSHATVMRRARRVVALPPPEIGILWGDSITGMLCLRDRRVGFKAYSFPIGRRLFHVDGKTVHEITRNGTKRRPHNLRAVSCDFVEGVLASGIY